ncbi:MAG: hypothetical protein ABIJ57_09285 [Pseudomonadota bacterium]
MRTIFRSRIYREFVAMKPCMLCGLAGPSDAHHESVTGDRGMGVKPPDSQVIPLCRLCHTHRHAGFGPETEPVAETMMRQLTEFLWQVLLRARVIHGLGRLASQQEEAVALVAWLADRDGNGS